MKLKFSFIGATALLLCITQAAFSKSSGTALPISDNQFLDAEDYQTQVTFPAGYVIGDYIEFVKFVPASHQGAGNYEISLTYTRTNVVGASTHLASVTHANPDLWREAGRVNTNGYIGSGSQGLNFTVDCNGAVNNARFRIRAIRTLGTTTAPIVVYIKIRSINKTTSWTAYNATGNDLLVTKFQPMTNDWSLYVGNPYLTDGAVAAIKVITNGNVGIGTATPDSKLSVNGKVRAHEIKVETNNWPDYVFDKSYALPGLREIETYIGLEGHLPSIPSAAEVVTNGIELGDMNARLLKKIEELTLHLIQMEKRLSSHDELNKRLQQELDALKAERK